MKDPNAKNASENATNKGGKLTQHPPAAGSHAPKSVHTIPGGHLAGGSVIHPSLKKSK
jgi:hypothetical protein